MMILFLRAEKELTIVGCWRVQPMNMMEKQFKLELPVAPRTQMPSHGRGGEARYE